MNESRRQRLSTRWFHDAYIKLSIKNRDGWEVASA
jgi:hypothetical protein